jgi:hypothetical protein
MQEPMTLHEKSDISDWQMMLLKHTARKVHSKDFAAKLAFPDWSES